MKKVAAFLLFVVFGFGAWAQVPDGTWVQIEAQPSKVDALERARNYDASLDNVNSFRLRSGWYVIALGPFTQSDAAITLANLRAARAIPGDSFIADGQGYRERVFGQDMAVVTPETADEPDEPLAPLKPGEETLAEAKASERLLTRDERALVQIAMKWEGVYDSAIDASFGPGTRRAMALWQESKRYEPTGVLTTLQRRELVDDYEAVLASIALTPVTDTEAGIDIALPLGLVKLDRYQAPFVHYKPVTGENVSAYLISQEGTQETLAALFDIMQTLEVVPLDGKRKLNRKSFLLTGVNEKILSYTYVVLSGETIKGFTLVWPSDDPKRFQLAVDTMRESFTVIDGVLPDTAGAANQNIDLLAGLEVRKPGRSRSGFYVDGDGTVITTSAAVQACTRVTLDDETEVQIIASDDVKGLALLQPSTLLSPMSIAPLASVQPRLNSDVAVAGYSFGGILNAPSLTFGTLTDVKGLSGEQGVYRLELASEPSDAGGPIFDASGSVAGILLDATVGERKLPNGVVFGADINAMVDFISANSNEPLRSKADIELAPEDMALLASEITVLVSCWN